MTAGLYLLAGSWIAGIALQGQLRQLGPLLALAAVASLLLGWRRRKWLLALGCCGLCTAGLLWGSLRSPVAGRLDPARQAPLERVELSGTVSSDLSQTGPRRWTLDLDVRGLQNHDQALAAKGRVRVHLKADQVPSLRIGDRVRLHGRLALPAVALNFGAFSYRNYLRQQGIFAVVYAQELDKTADGAAWLPQRLLQHLRRGILQGFERRLPLGQARLLGSLLLGSGASPVPDEIQARFQAAGLQHVLAVSGFQVQLVLLGVLAGCQLLRLGRGPSFGLALTALWIFVALTGFPASVLRAGVVASLGLVGYLRFRQLDVLAGLVLGCSGLLLLEPWLLSDIGFQFSVLATAGLVLMSSWLQEKMDWLPLPVSAACAPVLAAQLWVLPAQLWHFGSFSWLFLPANLLAGFLTTALSWLAIAAAATTWLAPLQTLVLIPSGWLCSGLLLGLELLLKLPSPVLMLPTLATSLMLLAYAALLMLKHLQSPKIRLVLLACVLTAPLLSGALWLGERHHCPVSVTFLAVGQGDAALIETPSMVILVDAGPRWETDAGWEDAGKRDILPYLQRRGIRRIDLAITSHPHLDHYGGYYSLVEKLKIGRFITVRGAGDSPAYLALLTALQKKGVAFEYVQNGSLLPLAKGLKLIFWQPLADPQASLNDQSLVVQLVHQDVRFLLSGDLEAAGEAALLAMPGFEPRHSILKVPHHGSSTSSSDDFLAQVAPAEAIVSVGERNKYHHPTPEVMERYAGLGIRTWRTDQNGAVCVCSRGKGYEIRTAVVQREK